MGTFVPFGEWLPDLPPFENPGATVAKNVLPDAKSYRSFPTLETYTQSIGGVCRGAIIARDTTGTYYNYVGDASILYASTQLSWSNVSRVAGGIYTMVPEDYWEFAQFGNRMIGVNGLTDAPQAISLGAANFTALAGSPPKAKHIATIRDFVVMGNLSASASNPQMVRWCAINNADSWTPDAATLADFQDLPGDGGWVQKIVGGEYGTIFQERAIFRMTFVGSPLIFQFDKIQTSIGAYAPQSVVNYRNFSFFLSEDGFYMFDGTNVVPIGNGKVDRTFFDDLDVGNVHRVHGIVDAKRKIVAWAYPGTGNIGGNPNRLLIYNWAYKRWSRIEGLNIELLLRAVTGTYTLDGLDSITTNLDLLTTPLDDSSWQTGNFILAAFNANHRLSLFNGSAMPATVETAEQQFDRQGGGLSYITEARPITEGLSASLSLAVATRDTVTRSATYMTAVQPNSAGIAEVRATGRFHRFRLTTGSDFEHLMGIDVDGVADGSR